MRYHDLYFAVGALLTASSMLACGGTISDDAGTDGAADAAFDAIFTCGDAAICDPSTQYCRIERGGMTTVNERPEAGICGCYDSPQGWITETYCAP